MKKLNTTKNFIFAFALILSQIAFSYAQTIQLTLTPATFNGYNISCFGNHSGSINLTVSGGTAPYTFNWSNGETIEDINNLVAGYYEVRVTDNNLLTARANITLTEPEKLRLEPTIYQYPNGFEISCNNCFNGSITLSLTGGVASYTYLWNNNSTIKNRSSLGSGAYYVTATDANGCYVRSEQLVLREPDRNDWTLLGNTNSNSATNFIGTTDNKDLVIKTNNAERIKVLSNGDTKIDGLAGNGIQMLFVDNNGILKGGSGTTTNTACTTTQPPTWFTKFNGITKALWTCPDVQVGIGTYGFASGSILLQVAGDAYIEQALGVGIPVQTGYKLCVDGKVGVREIYVRAAGSAWPDYVFKKNYLLLPLNELQNYITKFNHLPGLPAATEVEKDGNINLGDLQVKSIEKLEELTLYILQLKTEIENLKKDNVLLKKAILKN